MPSVSFPRRISQVSQTVITVIPGQPLAVEGGLKEPALAKPAVALGEKEPVAAQRAQPEEPRTLLEVPASRDEDLFDGVGAIDQPHAEGAQPCLDPVTYSRAHET